MRLAAASLLLFTACAAGAPASAAAPKSMVAAAHPLAVDAGVRILQRGGSAIDAMIAVQLVLNLVEPGSSGLGGGAFLVYYDARRNQVYAYDGREVAPSGATPELFLQPDGTPMPFQAARVSGRAVGVPGTPRLLELAHVRHGRLPWKTLFHPAIELAEKGFPMSPRLHRLLSEDEGLADERAAAAYFFGADGRPKPVGARLRNPELARTLRAIAEHGADAFYEGDIARDIVAAVRGHRNPGTMSMDDLASYRVQEVEPLCGNYRAWKLCGMPPSSSGGVAVLQILGMLERFDMPHVRPGSAEAVHLVTEAERLAFADRARYLADDRFVHVPLKGLVDRGYIASRSQLIRIDRTLGTATAGEPKEQKVAYADDAMNEPVGTTQISIVDADGNAVAMTSSIEWTFGSRIMVRGFLLNNELTDFSFRPVIEGVPVANAVAPGKRPRSSMSPFLVFARDGGALEMSLGSAGGSFIIGYVTKALVAMLDWKMSAKDAIDSPNFDSRNGPTEIERGTELENIAATLKSVGHDVRALTMESGTQAIRRVPGGWEGGADRRREGIARGH